MRSYADRLPGEIVAVMNPQQRVKYSLDMADRANGFLIAENRMLEDERNALRKRVMQYKGTIKALNRLVKAQDLALRARPNG